MKKQAKASAKTKSRLTSISNLKHNVSTSPQKRADVFSFREGKKTVRKSEFWAYPTSLQEKNILVPFVSSRIKRTFAPLF
jgi:hypothetical protein